MTQHLDVNSIEAVLFDLDGTVYYGSKIIPGANETIEFFRSNGKPVYFTTNNSTKTHGQIYERLQGMGVDCRINEVLTSGYLAALYAKKRGLNNLFIFGSSDLVSEFEAQGVTVTGSEDADNLLIGYDPRMTYEGLTSALQVALHADCIIACNRERRYPGEGGRLMPGCGAMTAPIEWCAERECDVIIGKPSTMMIDLIADERGFARENVLVIGDTFESDVEMAWQAGAKAVLISKEPRKGIPTVRSIAEVPSLFSAG